MSSSWQIKGLSKDGKELTAVWGSRSAPQIELTILENKSNKCHRCFGGFDEFEDYAEELGVKEFVAEKTIKAYPIPRRIPIRFPDSIDQSTLAAILRRLEKGEKLNDLSNEFSFPPSILRIWLIGQNPSSKGAKYIR